MSILSKSIKRYFAFLFSDAALKIAKISSRKRKLDFFYETALPPNLIVQGDVKDPKLLTDFLLKLKSHLKINNKYVVVGISDHKAVNHTLILPRLKYSEINEALRREVSTFLPFPYKDEYVDWMLIEKMADGKEKILVCAIPKNTVEGYTLALQNAKLHPIAFETKSISLFRQVPETDRELSFVLEANEENSILILVRDGSIETTTIIKDNSSLISEVVRIKKYYIRAGSETAVSKPINIYLCGKQATNSLAQNLKTEALLNPLAFEQHIENIAQEKKLELTVLVSLALKEVQPPNDEKTINILPEGLDNKYLLLEKERKERKSMVIFSLLFLFLAGAVFLSFFNLHRQRGIIEDELARLEQKGFSKIASVSPQKADLVIKLENQSNQMTEIFSEIVSAASGSVQLTGLKYDGEKKEVSLAGSAAARERLLNFKEKLEEAEQVKKVFVPLSSLESANMSNFRMIVSL